MKRVFKPAYGQFEFVIFVNEDGSAVWDTTTSKGRTMKKVEDCPYKFSKEEQGAFLEFLNRITAIKRYKKTDGIASQNNQIKQIIKEMKNEFN